MRDQTIGVDRASRVNTFATDVTQVEDVSKSHGLRHRQHHSRVGSDSPVLRGPRHHPEKGVDPLRVIGRQRSFDLGQGSLRGNPRDA